MEDNILEIRGLSKSYGDFRLSEVNISLTRGYIMGFIGANGAGKTTTIKLIMNMVKKDSGEIKVFGRDHVKDELYIKNKVGYVSEQPVFYENETVAWNVNFAKKFYDRWDHALFEELLIKFKIDKFKKINQLSKGIKMKTALAIALSHHPELLILDEPTSGLDPIVRDELLGILMEFIQDENKSVFFSSHITSDIEKIGDYVTFIDKGKIILSEEKDTILEEWKIVKGDAIQVDNYKQDLIGIEQTKSYFKALVKDFHAFKAKYDISSLVIEKPSLDDILLHLTKKGN